MEPIINVNPGATKWDIREKVWDYIEAKNLANFPRPVYNRIPNFKGAIQACDRLATLQEFKSSQTVKVNPDRPQQQARTVTLEARKTLLVPTPRLRTGLFNRITPPQDASKEELRVCSTSQGVKEFSVPVGLEAKVQVDLVVVGSVAVSEKGFRIGKGEGFADLEYGMMVCMGAVSESTVVVTVVHDCQVLDIPEELMESHDLTVDYILTPTRVIKTDCQRPKPQGIIWTKLDPEMLEKIPILKKLRELEEQAGKDVTLGEAPVAGSGEGAGRPRREPRPQGDQRARREPRRRPRRNTQEQDAEGEPKGEFTGEPLHKPRRRQPRVRRESRGEGKEEGRGEGGRQEGRGRGREKTGEDGAIEATSERRPPLTVTTVYLGGIPAGLRVSELKTALREREAAPLRLTWQGAQHRAFLDYVDSQAADQALEALQGLSLNGHSLQAELAKSQRGGRRPGPPNRRPGPPNRRPRATSGSKAAPAESASVDQAATQGASQA